jgi:hypothetical protein
MLKLAQFGGLTSTVVALVLASAALTYADDKDIIINEVMYHPPLDLEDLQYVELYNRGKTSVDLSGWSFSKGIKYVFPKSTRLEAGEYLVICQNVKAFAGNYGGKIAALGDFEGKISHRGEKIELDNAEGAVIDKVKFSDSAPWPTAPDGHSTSLERISPFAPADNPANWASSTMPALERPAGSPGKRNDSFLSVVPPSITDVTFKTPPPDAPRHSNGPGFRCYGSQIGKPALVHRLERQSDTGDRNRHATHVGR